MSIKNAVVGDEIFYKATEVPNIREKKPTLSHVSQIPDAAKKGGKNPVVFFGDAPEERKRKV